MLTAWIEYHRTTLLLKCEGLTAEDLRARPVATTLMSLHGLVRHMAEVERNWFRRVLVGESRSEAPLIYYDPVTDPGGHVVRRRPLDLGAGVRASPDDHRRTRPR